MNTLNTGMLREKLQTVFNDYCDGFDDAGKKIHRSFREKCRIQQKNQPEAHRLKNAIVELSKISIEAVRSGDKKMTEYCFSQSLESMKQLVNLDLDFLPGFKSDRCGEAGQEFTEMVYVILLYPVVINNEDLPEKFPDPFELFVNIPEYLAGIQDAIGEVGKLLDDFILDQKVGFSQEYELKERFIAAATAIYDTMFHEFVGIPQSIINNSSYREYRQSFQGRLGGMRNIIERKKQDLLQIRYHLPEAYKGDE